jgi:branched-chain amino acid transport system ATP-binding protein
MAEAVIELREVTRSFGALRAVDAVSLDLRPQEIHALIGPNGAGKSTLVRLVAGELAPDAGTIRLAGKDIGARGEAARARLGLARSFQVSSVISDFTALQNVMLAAQGASGLTFRFLRPTSRDRSLTEPAEARLAEVGLTERAGVRAGTLSHGERRRLEIAMALALAPRAFLLDEPMAGMDPEGAKAMTTLLSDLRASAPILLIEHDMDAVFALADRVSVLVYGRVIASGSVAEIRADPLVQRAYLGEDT